MADPVRIGEAARLSGLSAHTLRNYEDEGLIVPHRTRSGDRLYTEEHLKKIAEIKVWKARNWVNHSKEGP